MGTGIRWELAPRQRVDVVAFAGINLSGERRVVEIHAVGGRQGDLGTEDIRSLVLLAPIGTRIVLCTSEDPERWIESAWRCAKVTKDSAFRTKEGRTAVRIPDLDWYDEPDARRTDPDLQASFEEAVDLSHPGWTFGRLGNGLKGRIKQIRIDKP